VLKADQAYVFGDIQAVLPEPFAGSECQFIGTGQDGSDRPPFLEDV
jgi:hypothetical protein